jgi:hypothetical protein
LFISDDPGRDLFEPQRDPCREKGPKIPAVNSFDQSEALSQICGHKQNI